MLRNDRPAKKIYIETGFSCTRFGIKTDLEVYRNATGEEREKRPKTTSASQSASGTLCHVPSFLRLCKEVIQKRHTIPGSYF